MADGGSTDGTPALAARLGARVVDQDPRALDEDGRLRLYGLARAGAASFATRPWLLFLDSDEELTEACREEIAAIVGGGVSVEVGVGRLPVEYRVGGRPVRSAANLPQLHRRLFRRSSYRGYSGVIDEQPMVGPGTATVDLRDGFVIDLLPLRRQLQKWARYQRLIYDESRRLEADERHHRMARRWRDARWLAWRTWKVRRGRLPDPMPLRYEAARVGFALVAAVSLAAGGLRPARPTVTRPSGSERG